MAPTPEYPPSAHPDALLYFHLFRSVGPRGGANLLARGCSAALAGSEPPPRCWHATRSERTGRRTRFSSTSPFFRQREQPLLETPQRARQCFHHPSNVSRFRANNGPSQLFVLLFALHCERGAFVQLCCAAGEFLASAWSPQDVRTPIWTHKRIKISKICRNLRVFFPVLSQLKQCRCEELTWGAAPSSVVPPHQKHLHFPSAISSN